MFDLPDAKRVRRSDLYTRSQSASPTPSEPDADLEAQFRARLASIYGTTFSSIPQEHYQSNVESGPVDEEEEEDDPEQEFEFRLFSSTAPTQPGDEKTGTTQKIILKDEEKEIGKGGFVVPDRNRGYYFAQTADGERRQGFEVMALSGEEVLSRARRRAWGLEVPWRVRVLKVGGKKKSGTSSDAVMVIVDEAKDTKKKKLGKKRRIVSRERKRNGEVIQEKMKAEKDKKEEADREKRTRRNRQKKVKRKMKEKAKKAGDGREESENGAVVSSPPPK